MPDKKGRFSPQEKAFVGAMVRSNDPTYSATVAGYSSPQQRGSQSLAKPEIQRAIVEQQLHKLRTDGVMNATAFVCGIFTDPHAPAGAKVQAAKLVFDVALATHEESEGKPLHSMSRAELQAAAEAARAHLAELDAPTIDHEPTPQGGVFD